VQANCDIACPGYGRWVKGFYDTDKAGKYLVGENGLPIVTRTFCYESATCPHGACILHRRGLGKVMPKAVRLYPNTVERVPAKRRGLFGGASQPADDPRENAG